MIDLRSKKRIVVKLGTSTLAHKTGKRFENAARLAHGYASCLAPCLAHGYAPRLSLRVPLGKDIVHGNLLPFTD